MYAIQKTVMTLLLLVATAAFATGSMANGDNASKAAPMKFVGTFYTLGEDEAITSYHSDGTMSNVASENFSDDAASIFEGRKATGAHGVWRVVGDNTIRVTTIRFLTETFGHNFKPDGIILKTTWEAVFDEPVQGRSPGMYVETIYAELFLPGQNPITDEPLRRIELPFGQRAVRLEVE